MPAVPAALLDHACNTKPCCTVPRNMRGLLERYLVASNYEVREALLRLEATAKWRKEWNVSWMLFGQY